MVLIVARTSAHRIPVLDKTAAVLNELARRPEGASTAVLSRELKLPISTVYRMLNTLSDHGIVMPYGPGNHFALGPTLLRLARSVPRGWELGSIAQAAMANLANKTGETVKLSVRDGHEAVVVAVVVGPGPYSISGAVGRRFRLHAGAASKVLLAYAPQHVIDQILSQQLPSYTAATVTDPQKLRAELRDIIATGCAEDRGEFVENVRAVAAPVFNEAGEVVAALSLVSVASAKRQSTLAKSLVAVAKRLSRDLGHLP